MALAFKLLVLYFLNVSSHPGGTSADASFAI